MSKRILVVDDEELLIKSMNRLLEKQGYQVYTAKNGQDAQILAEEEDFDLVICDIRMPGQNGVETVKAIKSIVKSNKNKDIPAIFVTGFADDSIRAEAQRLSPLAYLMKPFDIKELIEVVQKGIGK